ncbi:hypothetical protein DICPUDRAFT_149495 [Dictyostelium purpureum]|uniref:Uncharacterized protein n=1 Tax=Dictyostelium purpureum TaxID=5786 RepID=F0ZDW3_DICPU|nr:uncharacterized protein DICPUDRAFT_149495 [Dictyostelium purpureum]EGC37871.1 hypothetical protein DICPUDRAFT_149495 [Dictyostelium purpureum]|eukprot:XP_003285621.1 hypothetical protein DICPUDRAFT_149495 [Dictyostelium purpureum]
MKKKLLASIGTVSNIISFILTIVALFLPWYSISIQGTMDQYYDTSVKFGLNSISCTYLNNDSIPVTAHKTFNNFNRGSECYPIIPPSTSLFGLGIGMMISILFFCFSLLPALAAIVLQTTMVFSPRFRVVWVKIAVFVLALVTFLFMILGFIFSSTVHTGLQSYSPDDQHSTSSDEITSKLCDELWCISFQGSSNYSPLIENCYSKWGPASGFKVTISACVFTLVSSIVTLSNSLPKEFKRQREYTKI